MLAFAYALWRGRGDEKIAASVALLATIATQFAMPPPSLRYSGIQFSLVAIDIAVLAAFVAIALRSKRFWPLWVAGLQLTNSMSHLMKGIESDLIAQAYAAAAVFWSYPILLIIIAGTWRTHQRERQEQAIVAYSS
ncbi:MAG: hypothetical protein ACREB1_00640 [Sphingomicrobium sp.]